MRLPEFGIVFHDGEPLRNNGMPPIYNMARVVTGWHLPGKKKKQECNVGNGHSALLVADCLLCVAKANSRVDQVQATVLPERMPVVGSCCGGTRPIALPCPSISAPTAEYMLFLRLRLIISYSSILLHTNPLGGKKRAIGSADMHVPVAVES